MDSPRGDQVDLAASEQAADSAAGESASPRAETGTSPQVEASCSWRTDVFHDGECDRYYDCPAHTISRAPPADEGASQNSVQEEGGETGEGVLPATAAVSDDDPYDSPGAENNTESHAQAPTLENTTGNGEQSSAGGRRPESPLEDRAGQLAIDDDAESDDSASTSSRSFPTRTTSLRAQLLQRGFVIAREPTDTDDPSTQEQDDGDTFATEDAGMEASAATASSAHTRRSSSGRNDRDRRSSLYGVGAANFAARERQRRETPEYSVPRWQPDAEVTYCPICNAQFSIFIRKHHCRKCGRVVCNSCSPHRIIIPHQYIVRQPGYEMPYAPSFFMDNMGGGYWEAGRMSGGERVRLCNPCVPDPNTEPPLSPSPRSPHQRSRSSFGSSYGAAADTGRFPGFVNALPGVDASQYQSSRSRSITMGPGGQGAQFGPAGTRSASYQTPLERYMRPPSASNRRSLYGSSSRQRALPPTPQIPEEDECPVCHRELPQRALLNYEALREAHITSCIQSHSTYGSPRGVVPEGRLPVPPRRSGMYTYPATEKDCVDDAECTICLEEFTVGVGMARLECLCRFHRTCIAAWFVNHPGRCPVHQHDGFGY